MAIQVSTLECRVGSLSVLLLPLLLEEPDLEQLPKLLRFRIVTFLYTPCQLYLLSSSVL